MFRELKKKNISSITEYSTPVETVVNRNVTPIARVYVKGIPIKKKNN